jgi:CHAT domain-containing protein/Tfp pilus assembly protein PilF
MRQAAKLLGLVVATVLSVPGVQSPGLGRSQSAPQIPSFLELKISQAEETYAQNTSHYVFETGVMEEGSAGRVYSIELEAGQTVTILFASDSFDPKLVITDIDGVVVSQSDNIGNENLDARLTATITTTGTHGIWLINNSPEIGGEFFVLVAENMTEQENEEWAEHLEEEGQSNLQNAQVQDALELWEHALAIYVELGDSGNQSRILANISSTYYILSKYEDSIHAANRALAIAGTDNESSIAPLLNRGTSYIAIGSYEAAIDSLQRALDISREKDNLNGQGLSSIGLGHVYLSINEYQTSLSFFQGAINLLQEDQLARAIALNGIGLLYSSLGQYETAIDSYQKALSLAEDYGDVLRISSILGNLGQAYYNLGEYASSIEYQNQHLALSRSINFRAGEARALGSLANVYSSLGNHDIALEYYSDALEIFSEINDERGFSDTLGNIGNSLLDSGNYQEAMEYLESYLELSRQSGALWEEYNALYNLGRAHFMGDNFTASENYLLKAVDKMSELRSNSIAQDASRVSLFDLQQGTFSLLQRVLVSQSKFSSSLEVAEMGRTRILVDLLTARFLQEDSANVAKAPNVDSISILARQSQNTLVEYSIIRSDRFDPILYVWVVSPDGNITFRQKSLTDIDLAALVTDTRNALGVGEYSRAGARPITNPRDLTRLREEADENLQQLYQLLIDPIADLLPTDPNQKVAFIPQGELFLVPFPALKDANGQYLIENHTILTAPSIQVLQLTQDLSTRAQGSAPLQADNPLIVGDPAMPTVTFLSEAGNFEAVRLQPLYGARQEAEAVGDTLNASALLGDAATEARVKQQIASADLIHLATHGLLEYGDPRQTGSRDTPGAIALAPGNGEDGLLTSTEILQMELQADLVVLSACDTGRGRITGDGVIGLSRSFIAAGVPSVIVSLWAVPDAPTAELMSEFYDQLAQGQTKAQALRQAMLITMQTRPDPKDWAAFTLIGNAE